MKALLIALVIVIAGLATWRIIAGRVDLTKPEAVTKAFMGSLKANQIDKAAKYWVPESADAWRAATAAKIEAMQSGSFTRFFEGLPDGSAPFTVAPRDPKAPANEQVMTSNGTNVTLRQVDNKWYVCKAPI
ncbi:MAG: hypothetical protein H7Z14_21955 [Anaerolineae bacterium]|nr:hypothetical protein [Phycisphaerae bacterium]